MSEWMEQGEAMPWSMERNRWRSFFFCEAEKKAVRCEHLAKGNGYTCGMNERMKCNERTKKNKNAGVNGAEWTIKKNEWYFFCRAKPCREARNGTDGEAYFFAKRKNKPPDVSTWRTVMAMPCKKNERVFFWVNGAEWTEVFLFFFVQRG